MRSAGCGGLNGMRFLHGPELALLGQSNVEAGTILKDAASSIAIGAVPISAGIGQSNRSGLHDKVEMLFPLIRVRAA